MKDQEVILSPDLLLSAYASGIFPMAEARESSDIFWVDPNHRGILPLHEFHISRSLSRRIRKGGYDISLNASFRDVVTACANRSETWISHEIEKLYDELHQMGFAHSLEIWEESALIGGVYGVALGGAFFGESMFSRRTDGSKLALAHLTHHLNRCNFVLFDTQFITPHLMSLGAVEIPRHEYKARLKDALEIETSIHAKPLLSDPYSVIHRSTQTS